MGSSNTKIMIWNMALDLLREQPLAAITDEKATAKWLTRNYDQQRDYLLERLPWKFALDRDEIAADATAPAWGWSYRYLLPTDALRIMTELNIPMLPVGYPDRLVGVIDMENISEFLLIQKAMQ